MFSKIKAAFKPDSPAITAAKALPEAYRDMLGLNFMVCEDSTDPDAWGMGDPIALAEVKNADNETGSFDFFFVIQDKEVDYLFDRFKSELTVTQEPNGFTFKAGGDVGHVVAPVTPESLIPVLQMALRHRVQVPLK